MASSKVEMENSDQKQLKHLGFVRTMAINAVVVVSYLYDYAKQNSGPLKSTVGAVENAVSAVVGPVYLRFRGLPEDVLVFVDRKVDYATHKFDESAPPFAKKVASAAHSAFLKASKLMQDLVQEAQVSGPYAAISHVGELSKQFAVFQLAVVWYKANHFPPLHGIAEMALPTAAHWSEKYNKLVTGLTAKGYSVFGYLPLVPVEEIARSYKQIEAGAAKKEDRTTESSSDSD